MIMASDLQQIKISVLVVTYNPKWDALRRTLYSIIMQEDAAFEIIVSDDGSRENHFDKVREYFAQNNFTQYVLVENKENQGTVKNVLSGLKYVSGRWVKPISPGDFLYDVHVLRDAYDFITNNSADFYFWHSVYYSFYNNNLLTYDDKANPHDIRPYLNNDLKQIKRNIFLYSDYILGANILSDTALFASYLQKLSNFVVYSEDFAFMYMIARGMYVKFIPIIGGCYEYGTGISTDTCSPLRKKIMEENKKLFTFLFEKNLIDKWLYKIHCSPCFFQRFFLKLIYAPKLIFRRFLSSSHTKKGYDNLNYKIDNIRKIVFYR